MTFNPYTATTTERTLPSPSKPLSLSTRTAILTPVLFVFCMMLNTHNTDRTYIGFPELMTLEYSGQGLRIQPNWITLALVLFACHLGSRLFCSRFAKVIDRFPGPHSCSISVAVVVAGSIVAGAAQYLFPALTTNWNVYALMILAVHLVTVGLIFGLFQRYLFAIVGSIFAITWMLFSRYLVLPLVGVIHLPWGLLDFAAVGFLYVVYVTTSSFIVFLFRRIRRRDEMDASQSRALASPSSSEDLESSTI